LQASFYRKATRRPFARELVPTKCADVGGLQPVVRFITGSLQYKFSFKVIPG